MALLGYWVISKVEESYPDKWRYEYTKLRLCVLVKFLGRLCLTC